MNWTLLASLTLFLLLLGATPLTFAEAPAVPLAEAPAPWEVLLPRAYLSFHTGNDLLDDCQEALRDAARDHLAGAYCLGKLAEATSALAKVDEGLAQVALCLPPRVTAKRLARVVVKFLTDNPHLVRLGEDQLVEAALIENFSCTRPH